MITLTIFNIQYSIFNIQYSIGEIPARRRLVETLYMGARGARDYIFTGVHHLQVGTVLYTST